MFKMKDKRFIVLQCDSSIDLTQNGVDVVKHGTSPCIVKLQKGVPVKIKKGSGVFVGLTPSASLYSGLAVGDEFTIDFDIGVYTIAIQV